MRDGGTLPVLSPTISCGMSRPWPVGSPSLPGASCWCRRRHATAPVSSSSWPTVVSAGTAKRDSSIPSKPVTEMSPGTSTPNSLSRARSPKATRSLKAIAAVAPVSSTCSATRCPSVMVEPPRLVRKVREGLASMSVFSAVRRSWWAALRGGPATYSRSRCPRASRWATSWDMPLA